MLRTRLSAGLMITVMIGVTIWSAHDGGRSYALMFVAAVAVLSAMMLLASTAALLPETRLTSALLSGTWIFLFAPAWEWLAGRFVYPESVRSALLFAVVFGTIRYWITGRGPSRPPS